MDYYKIGQKIRHFRKLNNMSQEELANRIDISITHMSHIETGNTKLSLPVLVSLAEVLNVSTDELLFDSSEYANLHLDVEIQNMIYQCSPTEQQVLKDILKATIISLHKNYSKEVVY